MASRSQAQVEKILKPADVRINGKRPWDIQVHDERLYRRVLAQGTLGVGEAYMDGWWDAKDLEDLIQHVLRVNPDADIGGKARLAAAAVVAKIANRQNLTRSYKNVQHHYDIGNDLYQPMLGKTMAYSCGYWRDAKTLDEAQEAKLDLICRKLGLKPGMTVLDIGCGWGSFVHYAAKHYGVKCVGNTLSEEQAKFARQLTAKQPVEIIVQDYRELTAQPFDRIVSVGMFEHVGPRNYKTFMKTCDALLKPDGLMLLHTIGGNRPAHTNDPWIERYIFPGGMLPSIQEIAKATTGHFIMEDWHNFGTNYAKTLRAWWQNFDAAYPKLDHSHYDQRFYRMWKYYLLSCAANFSVRGMQLWQIVLSKPEAALEYKSVR